MSNAKQDKLKTYIQSNSVGTIIVDVPLNSVGLTHSELTAAINGTAWPDDPPPVNYVPAVVNSSGVYRHKAPDSSPASRLGTFAFRQKVNVDLKSLTVDQANSANRMAQLDTKEWIASQFLDVLAVDSAISPIQVPYYSQWTPDASSYRDDCGPACIHMLLDHLANVQKRTHLAITTNQLSSETTLSSQDNGLTTEQLIVLAARHGLKLNLNNNATFGAMIAELKAGRPVLYLISYGPITVPKDDQNFKGGHFFIAVGCTTSEVIVHDPDFWIKPNGGAFFKVPFDQFESAINTAPTASYQAAFVDPVQLIPVPAPAVSVLYDIYHRDQIPDMGVFAASQFGLIHKASEGTYEFDEQQVVRRDAARKVNPYIKWHVYHFCTGADIKKQVKWFVDHAQLDGTTAVWWDVEENPDKTATTEGSISAQQTADLVNYWHSVTKVWPGIYSAKWWFDTYKLTQADMGIINVLRNCPFWGAGNNPLPIYTDTTTGKEHTIWDKCVILQIGESKPAGVNDAIDTNDFFGTVPDFQSFTKIYAVPVPVVLPVDPPPKKFRNAPLSPHFMPRGDYNGVLNMAKRLHDAGHPFAWIKLVDIDRQLTSNSVFTVGGQTLSNMSFLEALQLVSPGIKTYLRVFDGALEERNKLTRLPNIGNGNGWANLDQQEWLGSTVTMRVKGQKMAQDYIDKFITPNPVMKKVSCHQIICEPYSDPVGTAQWWLGVLDVFEKTPYRISVYNFSVGYPGLPDPDNSDFWLRQNEVLERLLVNGYPIGYDAYTQPLPPDKPEQYLNDYTVLRPIRIRKLWLPKYQSIHWIFPEFGSTGAKDHWTSGFFIPGWRLFRNYMNATDMIVEAAFYWTEGDGGDAQTWTPDQVTAHEPEIEAGLEAETI